MKLRSKSIKSFQLLRPQLLRSRWVKARTREELRGRCCLCLQGAPRSVLLVRNLAYREGNIHTILFPFKEQLQKSLDIKIMLLLLTKGLIREVEILLFKSDHSLIFFTVSFMSSLFNTALSQRYKFLNFKIPNHSTSLTLNAYPEIIP